MGFKAYGLVNEEGKLLLYHPKDFKSIIKSDFLKTNIEIIINELLQDEEDGVKEHGSVNSDGILSINNQKEFNENTAKKYSGKKVEVLIKKRFHELSNNFRSYYFKVIIRESQKAYYNVGTHKTLNDIDLEFRDKFLYYEIYDEEKGKYLKAIHTLKQGDTDVSNSMFKEYCEMVITWVVMYLDYCIPYPNEVLNHEDMTKSQLRIKEMREHINNTL